ncbi:MAG: HNH endonuclease signature motif containing protein [Planctomycetota bacterium]|nr:HNH endonuclease signature motif containing protein [Planctomycetota bacterium]
MAHVKHQEVQRQYRCQCGYCGVTETDCGGALTVDHFRPVSHGGDESDDNLVYACFKCNQFKGDFFPSPDDQRHGRRVLHPLVDQAKQHMRLDEYTGWLEPLTTTGRFHIALLQLNRPALIQHRLQRRMLNWLVERRELLEDEVDMLTSTITGLELHVARLERLLGSAADDG